MRELVIAIGCFLLISIIYFLFLGDASQINVWEIRYYIFLVISTGVVSCFGILRIYNAVVNNTRFLIKSTSAMKTFVTSSLKFVRLVGATNQSNDRLKGVNEKLSDKIQGLSEVLRIISSKNKK